MGGDIKGGGMTHYEIPQMMNTAYQYSEGLQTPWPSYALELDNFANTMTMGKKKGYDRVRQNLTD